MSVNKVDPESGPLGAPQNHYCYEHPHAKGSRKSRRARLTPGDLRAEETKRGWELDGGPMGTRVWQELW